MKASRQFADLTPDEQFMAGLIEDGYTRAEAEEMLAVLDAPPSGNFASEASSRRHLARTAAEHWNAEGLDMLDADADTD